MLLMLAGIRESGPGALLADAHDAHRYWVWRPGSLLADAHDAGRYSGICASDSRRKAPGLRGIAVLGPGDQTFPQDQSMCLMWSTSQPKRPNTRPSVRRDCKALAKGYRPKPFPFLA